MLYGRIPSENDQSGHADLHSLTRGTNGDLTEDFSLLSQQNMYG